MLKFHKEDDGGGFFSIHVSDGIDSQLLAMCPSKRHAKVLLSVLRAFHGGPDEEMEDNETYPDKESTNQEETQTTTEEAVNEKSLIKLTTSRSGLRLISTNF